MTKKEAEELAYILLKIEEVPDGGPGIYSASPEIAAAALDAVAEIREKFPRISDEMEEWKSET
jgi:hypothetical protein